MKMTVAELIEQLKQIENQNALVVMSTDAEGNDKQLFSGDIEAGYWCPEERDTIHPDTLDEIEEYDGAEALAEIEEYDGAEALADYLDRKQNCVTLWP